MAQWCLCATDITLTSQELLPHIRPESPPGRLQFVRDTIEGRSVDLTASALGETFASKQSSLLLPHEPSTYRLGAYIALPGDQAAVVQLAFDKSVGAAPSVATIEKAWLACRDEISDAVHDLAMRDLSSAIDVCRLNVPTTPNAFVLKLGYHGLQPRRSCQLWRAETFYHDL